MILVTAVQRGFLIYVIMTHHKHGPAWKMAPGFVVLYDSVDDEAVFVAKDPIPTALSLDGQIPTYSSNALE
jgi:hypothetical protein